MAHIHTSLPLGVGTGEPGGGGAQGRIALLEEQIVDRLIEELLSVKEAKPGTEVHLADEDIFWLCRKCRDVRT